MVSQWRSCHWSSRSSPSWPRIQVASSLAAVSCGRSGAAYSGEDHYIHVYVSQIRKKLAAADPDGELSDLSSPNRAWATGCGSRPRLERSLSDSGARTAPLPLGRGPHRRDMAYPMATIPPAYRGRSTRMSRTCTWSVRDRSHRRAGRRVTLVGLRGAERTPAAGPGARRGGWTHRARDLAAGWPRLRHRGREPPMTETSEADAAHDRAHELRQLRPVQGRLAGDQYVRVVEPFARTFRREAPGHLIASERVLEPRGSWPRHRIAASGGDWPPDCERSGARRAGWPGQGPGGVRLRQHLLIGLCHRGDHASPGAGRRRAGAHHAVDHRHRHRARGGGHQLSADHSGLPQRRWVVHRGVRQPRAGRD